MVLLRPVDVDVDVRHCHYHHMCTLPSSVRLQPHHRFLRRVLAQVQFGGKRGEQHQRLGPEPVGVVERGVGVPAGGGAGERAAVKKTSSSGVVERGGGIPAGGEGGQRKRSGKKK